MDRTSHPSKKYPSLRYRYINRDLICSVRHCHLADKGQCQVCIRIQPCGKQNMGHSSTVAAVLNFCVSLHLKDGLVDSLPTTYLRKNQQCFVLSMSTVLSTVMNSMCYSMLYSTVQSFTTLFRIFERHQHVQRK